MKHDSVYYKVYAAVFYIKLMIPMGKTSQYTVKKQAVFAEAFFRRLIHLTTLKIYAMPNRYTENQGQKQRGAY